MAFSFTTSFFSAVDSAMQSAASSVSGNLVEAVYPMVSIGVVLIYIIHGIGMMLTGGEAIHDFVRKTFMVAMVCFFAGTSGFYQSNLMSTVEDLPETMAVSVVSGNSQSTNANLIDNLLSKGIQQGADEFNQMSIMSPSTYGIGLLGVVTMIATLAMAAIGGTLILMAKIIAYFLALLGPAIIYCWLWAPLRPIVMQWVNKLLEMTLVGIMFALLYNMFLKLLQTYIGNITADGSQNVFFNMGGVALTAWISIKILQTIPSLAGSMAATAVTEIIKGYADNKGKQLNNQGRQAVRETGKAVGQAATNIAAAAGNAALGAFQSGSGKNNAYKGKQAA